MKTLSLNVNTIVNKTEKETGDLLIKSIPALTKLCEDNHVQYQDGFVFEANVVGETVEIPVVFRHFETGANTPDNICGVSINNPSPDAGHVDVGWINEAILGALSEIEEYKLIDTAGLLLKVDQNKAAKMVNSAAGKSIGYIKMGYNGNAIAGLPQFSKKNCNSAWAELTKSSGDFNVGYVADPNGYFDLNTEKGRDDRNHARNLYNKAAYTMGIIAEGYDLFIGKYHDSLIKYYYLLWNLAAVKPDLAKEFKAQVYARKVEQNRVYCETKKVEAAIEAEIKETGIVPEAITCVADVKLVEGGTYYVVNTKTNAVVNTLVWNPTKTYAVAGVKRLVDGMEKRGEKLVAAEDYSGTF